MGKEKTKLVAKAEKTIPAKAEAPKKVIKKNNDKVKANAEFVKTATPILEAMGLVCATINNEKIRFYHPDIEKYDGTSAGKRTDANDVFWIGEIRLWTGKINVGFYSVYDTKKNLLTKFKSNFGECLSDYTVEKVEDIKATVKSIKKLCEDAIKKLAE